MSVLHHMLAPNSKDLFSKAIVQSGSIYGGQCFVPFSSEKAASYGDFFAKYIGCETLECLQKVPIEEIGFAPFLPRGSVDGGLSEDPILPEDPGNLFETGRFHQVPLLIGSTNMEGILMGDIFALIRK